MILALFQIHGYNVAWVRKNRMTYGSDYVRMLYCMIFIHPYIYVRYFVYRCLNPLSAASDFGMVDTMIPFSIKKLNDYLATFYMFSSSQDVAPSEYDTQTYWTVIKIGV